MQAHVGIGVYVLLHCLRLQRMSASGRTPFQTGIEVMGVVQRKVRYVQRPNIIKY